MTLHPRITKAKALLVCRHGVGYRTLLATPFGCTRLPPPSTADGAGGADGADGADDDEDEDDKWGCPHCTLLNAARLDACEACDTPNAAALPGSWSCGACTFLNLVSASQCEMCEAAPVAASSSTPSDAQVDEAHDAPAASPADTEIYTPMEDAPLTPADIKLLIKFDQNATYGPCIGLSRKDRWLRAEGFGLEPPTEVMALLSHVLDDSPHNVNVFVATHNAGFQ